MSFAYLGALLVSLAGLTTLDFKHKLAFFGQSKKAAFAVAVPFLLFVIWDLAGIASGIFFRGNAKHLTGVTVFPEFPVEELFFLGVLTYTALLLTARLARQK